MQAELEGLFMARKEEDKQWKAELDAFETELLELNGTLDATHQKWELAQLEMAEIIHLLDGIFNISEASNASVIRLLGTIKISSKCLDMLLLKTLIMDLFNAVCR